MNIAVRMPTPTQASAIERRVAFRAKIGESAKALHQSKAPKVFPIAAPPITALTPRVPVESPVNGPVVGLPDWYFFVGNRPLSAVPKVSFIVAVVANYYRLSVNEVTSQGQTADVVRARQVACYLARELTNKSSTDVGRLVGDRDHSTVLHAVKSIKARMLKSADLAFDIAILFEAITGVQQ